MVTPLRTQFALYCVLVQLLVLCVVLTLRLNVLQPNTVVMPLHVQFALYCVLVQLLVLCVIFVMVLPASQHLPRGT